MLGGHSTSHLHVTNETKPSPGQTMRGAERHVLHWLECIAAGVCRCTHALNDCFVQQRGSWSCIKGARAVRQRAMLPAIVGECPTGSEQTPASRLTRLHPCSVAPLPPSVAPASPHRPSACVEGVIKCSSWLTEAARRRMSSLRTYLSAFWRSMSLKGAATVPSWLRAGGRPVSLFGTVIGAGPLLLNTLCFLLLVVKS